MPFCRLEVREAVGGAGQIAEDAQMFHSSGSGIIGPDGHWIVGPVSGREDILYPDVSLTTIGGEQMALDAAGCYNRPDIFSVRIDETT